MSYFADATGVTPLYIPEMSREISLNDAVTVWKLFRLFLRERPDIVHTHTAKAGTVGRVGGFSLSLVDAGNACGQAAPVQVCAHVSRSRFSQLLRAPSDATVSRDRKIAGEAGYRSIDRCQQATEHRDWRDVSRRTARADQSDSAGSGSRRLCRSRVAAREVSPGALYSRRDDPRRHRRSVDRDQEPRDVSERRRAAEGNRSGLSAGRARCASSSLAMARCDESLESQKQALGLDADVIFVGSRKDPEYFYPALDVVALTSRNEGTPLTLDRSDGECASGGGDECRRSGRSVRRGG